MENKEYNPEYYFESIKVALSAHVDIEHFELKYKVSKLLTESFNSSLKAVKFDFSACSSKQVMLLRLLFTEWASIQKVPVENLKLDICFDSYDNHYDVAVSYIGNDLIQGEVQEATLESLDGLLGVNLVQCFCGAGDLVEVAKEDGANLVSCPHCGFTDLLKLKYVKVPDNV